MAFVLASRTLSQVPMQCSPAALYLALCSVFQLLSLFTRRSKIPAMPLAPDSSWGRSARWSARSLETSASSSSLSINAVSSEPTLLSWSTISMMLSIMEISLSRRAVSRVSSLLYASNLPSQVSTVPCLKSANQFFFSTLLFWMAAVTAPTVDMKAPFLAADLAFSWASSWVESAASATISFSAAFSSVWPLKNSISCWYTAKS
mmetsp:Transcript_132151/g.196890  ORF Transcript_132151/g.196890 Transcript_132151/m.196890 type:complete len:204 (-) Transcript_132151:264-875(-)